MKNYKLEMNNLPQQTHVIWRKVVCGVALSVGLACCAQRADWMGELSDGVRLTELCVPGAHDVATGAGFRLPLVDALGRTQSLRLREQWERGVRAFDLRPAVCGGDTVICHGPLKTRLTLAQALGELKSLLAEHPGEVAFVLLRREDSAKHEVAGWKPSFPVRLIDLDSVRTLGEARGGVVVLSRDPVDIEGVNLVQGWSHSAELRSAKVGAQPLWVEDVYDCSSPGRVSRKLSLLQEVMRQDGWVIAHTSGYFRPASACSNRRMAEIANGYVLELLRRGEPVKGLMMMDFVGEGAGGELTEALTEQNFRR